MAESMMDKILRARKETKILRMRKNDLFTFGATRLPYVFLADSQANAGDVVVRRGEVTVDRAKILTLSDMPQFEGFELEEGTVPLLMSRGVHLPAMKYENRDKTLAVEGGPMERAVEKVVNLLDRESNTRTGVFIGPDDLWALCLVHYVGLMIVRSAPSNLGEFIERFGLPQ